MGRRDFSSMLPAIQETVDAPPTTDPNDDTAAEPEQHATSGTKRSSQSAGKAPTSTRGRKKAPGKRATATRDRGVAGRVGFDELERKETRLTAAQYAELTTIARDLNRRRGGQGHRITENTLIRLGIDLLRERASDLSGTSEDELRESLQLP